MSPYAVASELIMERVFPLGHVLVRSITVVTLMHATVFVEGDDGELLRRPDGELVRAHRFRFAPPPAPPAHFQVTTSEDIREEVLRDYWAGGWTTG